MRYARKTDAGALLAEMEKAQQLVQKNKDPEGYLLYTSTPSGERHSVRGSYYTLMGVAELLEQVLRGREDISFEWADSGVVTIEGDCFNAIIFKEIEPQLKAKSDRQKIAERLLKEGGQV